MNRRPALISSRSPVSVRLRALLLLLGMLLCSTALAQTIVISPTTLPGATVGSAYSQTITASGGTAPYSFAITAGALPAGLTLASGGSLSGTPTSGGTFNFTVTATDSDVGGPFTGSRAYSLTVNAPTISVSPTTLPAATVASAYSQNITASGGTAPYSFAITAGALPAGLTLTSGGTLSGTPTAGGTFNFTMTATDSSTGAGPFTGSRAYSLTVNAPTISVSPTTLPSATVGSAYSQSIAASGGTAPYSFSLTAGSIPAGMTLSGGGILLGTPTAGGTFNFTVTAADSSTGTGPYTGSRAYSLTVNAPPTISISPTTLPDGTGGSPYQEAIFATGGTAPYTFTVTAGALPAGLTLFSNGLLSGIPAAGGTFNFTITATDAASLTGSRAYTLTVVPTITIAPAGLLVGQIFVPYSRTMTASGGTAPYSFAVTAGALPAGMSLSSTGLLSGTPTEGGQFNFTITATDSSGGAGPFTGSQAYTWFVNVPVTITPATLPPAVVGTPYSQTLTANNANPPFEFRVSSGSLPPGISLSFDGVLSGTPTASGTFNFNIIAIENFGTGPRSGEQAYTLTVAEQPPVANPVSATVAYGSGANPITLNITGGVPNSVAVASAPANGTVIASGTAITYQPNASFAGTDSFTYTATNAGGTSAPATVSITVAAPTITISPATLPAAVGGTPYSQALTASGGTGPYTFSLAAGTLPQGVSFSSAGVLSGTPVVAGTFNFTVVATDSSTGTGPFTASSAYTLTVSAPTITISPTTLLPTVAGTPYSQTLTASGGTGPYSFSLVSGALPIGMSFSSAGVLSGTAVVAGSYTFTVRATDNNGFTGDQAYTVVVSAPTITISPATMPAGTVGTPYNQTVTASGGTAPYSFSLSSGALPVGMSFSSAGVFSGTPTSAGTYNLGITATDALGFSASIAYSIVINDAVPVATNDSATVQAGEAITIPVTANDVGVLSSITIVSAPSVGTAAVSGLDVVYTAPATASGDVTFTYTATGPGGTSAPATVTVTVNPLPVAVSRTLTTPADTPLQTELTAGATGGPFTAATLVGVTPAGSGSANIAAVGSGFVLTFTPAAGFAGTATVQFTLSNAFATSNVASVQIEVGSRPDPTRDAEVVGMIDAQAESTRRFATAQIGNFQRRLERMHGADANANGIDNSLSLAMARPCVEARLGIDEDCLTQAAAATQLSAAPSERVNAAAPPVAIWIGGTIRTGRQDGRDGRADLDFETDGISIGADYRVSPAFAFGGGVGYGSDRTDVGTHTSRMRGDAYTAALYASFQPDKGFFIDGLVGYQTLSYDLTRYLSGTGGSVTGERDGSQWFASLSAGADITRSDLQITPYGRLDVAQAQLDAYVERGDPLLALQYDEMDVDTLTGNLGLRLDFRHDTEWGVFAPLFRVEYQHEFEDSGSFGIRYADLLSGPVYRGDATQFDRSRWMLGLGAMFATDHGWSFRIEVNGIVGSDGQRDNGGMIQVEKRY